MFNPLNSMSFSYNLPQLIKFLLILFYTLNFNFAFALSVFNSNKFNILMLVINKYLQKLMLILKKDT